LCQTSTRSLIAFPASLSLPPRRKFPDLGHVVKGYVLPSAPHWSRFKTVDRPTGIEVAPSPDEILVVEMGNVIMD